MMHRTGILALACVLLIALGTGCMGVATPAVGLLVSNVKWDGKTTAGKIGEKQGRACARSILALVAEGDASIEAAARNGGITTIESVDHETLWTLVYGEYCTIVRGR